MSPSETYQMVKLKSPEGVVLSDVFMIDNGKRRPVLFKKNGEVIDLEKVEVKSFVASALSGGLKRMTEQGTVVKIQQETSVRRSEELATEWARQTESPKHAKGNSSQAAVVQLEPGVYVAVGGGQLGIPAPAPSAIEAGVYAPPAPAASTIFAGVAAGGGKEFELPAVTVVDDGIGAVPATTGAGLADVSAVHGSPEVTADTEEKTWSTGLTLVEQEAFVSASKDKAFLNTLLTDDATSKKLKNLAKKALDLL